MATNLMSLLGFGGTAPQTGASDPLMGLLGVDRRRALQRGLLAAAAPLLEAGAGGRSPADASIGRALGRAGMAGLNAFDTSQTQDMTRGLARVKFANELSDLNQRRMQQQFAKSLLSGGSTMPNPRAGLMASPTPAEGVSGANTQINPQVSTPGLSDMDRQELAAVALKDGVGAALERRRNIIKESRTDFNKDYSKDGKLLPRGARKLEKEFRGEFNKDPSVKQLRQALPQWTSALKSARLNTRAADVSLVYAIAKIYDPTSVVREGEYAMVIRNSNNLPDFLQGYIKSVTAGKSALSAQAKNDLLSAAAGRMNGYRDNSRFARASADYAAKRDNLDLQAIYNREEFSQSYDISKENFADTKPLKVNLLRTNQRITQEMLQKADDTDLAALAKQMMRLPDRYSNAEVTAIRAAVKARGL